MNYRKRTEGWIVAWVDYFLPEGMCEVETVRRIRVSTAQAFVGMVFTIAMVALYASLGSRISAIAVATVAIGLAVVPWLLRQGASILAISNATVGLTYCATLTVVLRSGGFASPSVVWLLLLPPAVFAVCGLPSAVVWSLLAGVQMGGLYLASVLGMKIPQDFPPADVATLQLISYAGALGALLALLLVLDSARRASVRALQDAERALDRQRILDDMHDGVGSHLLGLLVESRAGTLRTPVLIAGLETCLDDLRLIVDSLDPLHASLEMALGALRARLTSRCEGLGVELAWDVSLALAAEFEPAGSIQVLRALQEMVTNALRHSGTPRIDVRIGARQEDSAEARIEISVRDYGAGMAPVKNQFGRGMKSLKMRAHKLGGALVVEPQQPGMRVAIELPRVPPNSRDTGSASNPL